MTWATHHRPRTSPRQRIGGILISFQPWGQAPNPQINLAYVEAGDLESKVEVLQRQLFQLFRKQAVVPERVLRQTVVGNEEGPQLSVTEMRHADGGHLAAAE